MNFGKFLVLLVLGVFGVFLAIKIVGAIIGFALHGILALVVPVGILVGVVYVIYRLTEKKVLGNDKRGILP